LGKGFTIHEAVAGEQAEIEQLDGAPDAADRLTRSILNRCLLVAKCRNRVLASAGIDLEKREIIQLRFGRDAVVQKVTGRLLEAVERLAARYGILELSVRAKGAIAEHLQAHGYRAEAGSSRTGPRPMKRAFPRRQTRYSRRVFALLDRLGIDPDYAIEHRIPLQPEAARLQSIGLDVFRREQRMAPAAAGAWQRMSAAAACDDVRIQVVSAFRSVDYQAGIVQRKLDQGQSMDRILSVSAAPGFSEHHTGRAIDLTTPGFDVLEEVFEQSPAFAWLKRHAGDFGFDLSFPRNNRHGVAFEPWHWAWNPRKPL
jgi:D-alanyl-D-alanine carboxypeptidase